MQLLCFAYLSAVALPLTLARAPVILENTPVLPPGWHLEAAADGKEPLSLSIALTQPGLGDLEAFMLSKQEHSPATATSDVLPLSQLLAYQAPHDGAALAVMDWLADNQIDDAQAHGPWIRFSTTVAGAKRLFDADVARYSYEDAELVLRAPAYSVPEALAGYIDFVFPLAYFMPPPAAAPPQPIPLATGHPVQRRQHPDPDSDLAIDICALGTITPACIRQLYNWPLINSSQQTTSPVRFGIAGFLDEYVNYKDVNSFLRHYAPAIARSRPVYNFSVELINGGANVQVPRSRAGIEASLDLEYAIALAFPAQITYYSTGGRGVKLNGTGEPVELGKSDNEPYLDLLSYLVGLPDDKVPHVLSISYGDDEQSVPQPYAMRVCDLFLQLTARGTSVLVATGDGGSRGIGRGLCVRNDGSGKHALLPTFPASCPWVTAVGAVGSDPPSLAASYSTGGFSDYFARPRWQESQVANYISTALQGSNKEGLYNASGRAIPDIAAVGSWFRIVLQGGLTHATGTSASTPVVASMIALINDVRLRNGRPPLGWLNHRLYSDGLQNVWQDIVEGVSKKCPFGWNESVSGWPAVPGWDAVTGLGVPHDFSLLMNALATA